MQYPRPLFFGISTRDIKHKTVLRKSYEPARTRYINPFQLVFCPICHHMGVWRLGLVWIKHNGMIFLFVAKITY